MSLNSLPPEAMSITVQPKVTGTRTEEWWAKFAARNGAVKIDISEIPKGNGAPKVDPLAANDKEMAGCLTTVQGSGDNFRANMQFRAVSLPVKNSSGTTALVAADFYAGVKGAGNGYLQIERTPANAVTGVKVVGGNTVADFLIAMDLLIPDITA